MEPLDYCRHSKIDRVHEREIHHNVRLVGGKKTNCLQSLGVGYILRDRFIFINRIFTGETLETVLVDE